MLSMTETAIDAIRELAPGEAGLRLYASELPGASGQEALQVEVAQRPDPDDQVVEAGGAHVFLDPSAAMLLEDKILDAKQEGSSVRFAVVEHR